ncbi:hypothetical protein AB205_0195510 [Aquarana catesbeiana]|uniref:Uncharacterized protein n=1 Tax=Aquarana catesbeiana TaxID=8400 RepID=A0A2G9P853_AQUCT|nr:hypothetical protein AB205_0195510 [Aquarana catesbeiana]
MRRKKIRSPPSVKGTLVPKGRRHLICAQQYRLPVPPASATNQCPPVHKCQQSVPPISASSVLAISVTYQCRSVPASATSSVLPYQCPSMITCS